VTSRDGVVYASTRSDWVTSHLERLEREGPLSEFEEFRDVRSELENDVLVFGYLSGEALDLPDFRDAVEEIQDAIESDPRDVRIGYTLNATEDGFAAEMLATFEELGVFEESLAQAAGVATAAGAVPKGSLIFVAATGLSEGLESAFEFLEASDTLLGSDVLEPVREFERDAGVDIERDILPNLTGTYAIAFGEPGEDPLVDPIEFALFLTEANEPEKLRTDLGGLLAEFEFLCGCNTEVTIDVDDGFVRVAWPDPEVFELLNGDRLDVDPGFTQMLELLPEGGSSLWYVNIAGFPDEVFDEVTEDNDFDVDALLGFGGSGIVTERSVRFSVAIPIAVE
jgi:hypothetical protein